MALLKIQRLAVLPAVLEASTIYITKNENNVDLVDLTVVGENVSEVRRLMGQADVSTAISTAIENLTAEQLPDIPAEKILGVVAEAAKLSPGATINGVQFTGEESIVISAEDTETPRVPVSALGDTVATLVDGRLPASQLPTGLDNVDEYATVEDFPEEGEKDVLYIDLSTNNLWRWTGSTYVQLTNGGATTGYNGTGLKTTVIDGLVQASEAFAVEDIPDLPGEKITSAVELAKGLEITGDW